MPSIGSNKIGFISVCEKQNLPFQTKRIYWTYNIPDQINRGGHAHLKLEQILLVLSGKVELKVELINGDIFEFILENPNIGVYIPVMSWRTMKYFGDVIQVCIASMEYDENDYIRNYDDFKKEMANRKI
jgi:hypothetical protein